MSEMYQRSTDEVLAELGTSVHGLSGKEAAERLARYGQNKLKEAHKITVFQRFLQQIKDPMLLILLAAAAVSAVTNILSHESFTEVIIILLVVLLNRSYIVSVIITFFYTSVNYIFGLNDLFITQPFGLNLGTLLPGPLTFRWYFQYLDFSNAGAEMLGLLERVSPYFVTTAQAFLVTGAEAAVFLALIALVYKRQGV